MGRQYTITQLAQAAKVPTTTLRYYERAGLVLPEGRSQGNYRLYSDESLRRLRFIRAAQAVGFTLDDVRRLLESPSRKGPSCREVQTLIQDRLSDIDKRLRDLQHVHRVLSSSLRRCRQNTHRHCCHVIATLHSAL
jgi:MerR family mercuric resistance operon transcriptional regulator